MIIIKNQGQSIVSTNYWNSDHAKAGYCFLSWNAGAARLLVPDRIESEIQEMRSARFVIVSRGPWIENGSRDALELLFEDGSDNPYCLHMVAEQTDRLLPEDNQGGSFFVTIWTKAGEKLRFEGKYRTVQSIPCLDPWVEQ